MDKQILEKLLSIYGSSNSKSNEFETSSLMDELSDFEVLEFTELHKTDLLNLLNDLLPELRPIKSFDLLIPTASPSSSKNNSDDECSSKIPSKCNSQDGDNNIVVSKNIMQIYWRLGTLVHFFNNFFDVSTVSLIAARHSSTPTFKDIPPMPTLESMNREKLDNINRYLKYWLRQFYCCDDIIDSLEYESGMVEMITLLILNIFSQLRHSLPQIRPIFDQHWDQSLRPKFDDQLQSIVRFEKLCTVVQYQLEQERIEHQNCKENLKKLQLELDEYRVNLQKSQDNVKKLRSLIDQHQQQRTSSIVNSKLIQGTSNINNRHSGGGKPVQFIEFSQSSPKSTSMTLVSSSSSSSAVGGGGMSSKFVQPSLTSSSLIITTVPHKQASASILNGGTGSGGGTGSVIISSSSSSSTSSEAYRPQLLSSNNSLLNSGFSSSTSSTSSSLSSVSSKPQRFRSKLLSTMPKRRGRPRKTLDGEDDDDYDEEDDQDYEEEDSKSSIRKHTYLAAPGPSKKIRFGPSGLGASTSSSSVLMANSMPEMCSGSITINRQSVTKVAPKQSNKNSSVSKSLIVASTGNQRQGLLNGKTIVSGNKSTYNNSTSATTTTSGQLSSSALTLTNLPKPIQLDHPEYYLCSNVLDKTVSCRLCNKRSDNVEIFARKHLPEHGGDLVFHCNWSNCQRFFRTNYKLKRHLLSHTGERPFKCRQCSKTFARSDKLKEHLRAHLKDGPPGGAPVSVPVSKARSATKESAPVDQLKMVEVKEEPIATSDDVPPLSARLNRRSRGRPSLIETASRILIETTDSPSNDDDVVHDDNEKDDELPKIEDSSTQPPTSKEKIECEEEIEDSDEDYDDDYQGAKTIATTVTNLVPNIDADGIDENDASVVEDDKDDEQEHQKAINETMADVVDGVSMNDDNGGHGQVDQIDSNH